MGEFTIKPAYTLMHYAAYDIQNSSLIDVNIIEL